jgi:two-component system, cell cycle sensor histidine kinase and response regulator CckA
VQLEMALDPSLHVVKVDVGQVEQVLMNLAVNAGDAMPQGGMLTIRTRNASIGTAECERMAGAREGEFVRLSVSDGGTGMDQETLAHIFEPFFTTKGVGKGTGLGLAVVYGIVAQHDGWIDVQSQPGEGSEFSVYLPAAAPTQGKERPTALSLERLRGSGERILVVEDEESVRSGLGRALEQNGYAVIEASNATEAVEIYAREGGNIRLLFSDVVLPGESGLDLAARLVAMQPELCVLLTSGYADRQAHRLAIGERGFRFLQKPYSALEMLSKVRDALTSDPIHAYIPD